MKSNKGFTLVEIILSAAILSIAIIAVTPGLLFATHQTQASRADLAAINLANQEMEWIRSLPFEQIGNVGGNPVGNIPLVRSETLDGITFTVNTTISVVSGTPNCRQVVIAVSTRLRFNGIDRTITRSLSSRFSRFSVLPSTIGNEPQRLAFQHLFLANEQVMDVTTIVRLECFARHFV